MSRSIPLIAGLTLVLVGCESASPASITSERPASTPMITQSESPDATASPSPSEAASPRAVGAPATLTMTWSELNFAGPVKAVIADRGRFVAIGGVPDSLTAWTSTDGVTWAAEDVPGPSTDHCAPDQPICLERWPIPGPMVRLGDTLYSFGGTQFVNDSARALAWRRTDGTPWESIESQSEVFSAGPFRVVAASDSAIFAVTGAGYPMTGRHWLWTAARSWREVGDRIANANPDEFRSAAWSDGTFIAVGTSAEDDPDLPYWEWPLSAAIWTSPDGASWTVATLPTGAEAVCEVRALGDFFVFGVADGAARVWRSSDGLSWLGGPLPGADDMAGCPGTIVEVAGGFLAFLPAGDRTLVWTSADGSIWHASDALPIPTHSLSIAALGDVVVAFGGRDPMFDDSVPILFVGSPSE